MFAQDNAISGKVFDKLSGESLPGATVRIKETGQGTITNVNGYYEIKNINQNLGTIEISYLGYKTLLNTIDFSKKKTLSTNYKIELESKELEDAMVYGTTKGQVRAMVEQREAINIKNIISADFIKKFPDLNAVDAIARIPGITVQKDQGEGRYVQLRGTPPELTNFNVNGEQISSPEGDVRYVGLDIISADQIGTIEVTKVLTPDMDADGIGGNINIITKNAVDTTPEISATIAKGYNDLMKTTNERVQFTYGQRYKGFGVLMNANYYVTDQGSHNMEYDYTRGPTLNQAQQADSTQENFHVLYDDIEFRHYTITRKRTGLSGNFDYKIKKNHTFYLRTMYNEYEDYEIRRRLTHDLSDANTELEYRETSIERSIRERNEIQTISTVNLGAEHLFGPGYKAEYEASYSYAKEDIPNYMFAEFDQGGIDLIIDKKDPIWPSLIMRDADDTAAAKNYSAYEFNDLTFSESQISDINKTLKLNLQIPYHISSSSGYFKFGGKIRDKRKERQIISKTYSKYYESLSMYSQKGPPLNLPAIEDNFSETNMLEQGYVIDHIPGPQQIRDFYEQHPQHFKLKESDTWEDTYQEDYVANENIRNAYVMFRQDISKFMFVGGVRYEETLLEYQAQDAWVDYSDGLLKKAIKIDKRVKRFALPQMQLKYSIDNMTNVRGAITWSYARPNFNDLIPYRKVNDNGDIEKGNPTLEYPLAMNIDLLGEKYLKNSGIISGGVFYKEIDNFVFNFVRRAHEGDNYNLYGLKEITMPVNGISAKVYGVEILTQSNFSFLPGFLKNFGIYTNYTFTESEALISKRYKQNDNDIIFKFDDYNSDFFTNTKETEVIPLPGQAKHTLNLALYYESKKFYAKTSANLHSEFLDELGNDAGLDTYYEKSLHIDFTANYNITKSLNVFVDLVNITNEPLRYYMGSRDYFKQHEYYSWTARMGIKLNI